MSKTTQFFLDIIFIWLTWRPVMYVICTNEFSGGLIMCENIESLLWSIQLVSHYWEHVIMWKKDIVVTFRIKLEGQKYNDKIICQNNPLPNDVTDVLGPRHLGCILSFDALFYGYKSIPLIMISPTKWNVHAWVFVVFWYFFITLQVFFWSFWIDLVN